jgi:hypothetical protein
VLSARYLALQRLYAEMFPEEACCHGKTKAAR